MKKSAVVLVIAVILVVAFLISRRQEPKEPEAQQPVKVEEATATLEIFEAPVSVVLPGATEQSDASDGQKIPEGTKVMTGEKGRVQVRFANASVTRLDGNTEITLKKLTTEPVQVEIKLEKRRIWSRVAKLVGQESFRTETATVVATVRGTSFGHGILPDGRNRVISRRGVIDTKCVNESQEAEVVPNKKILLDCTSGGKLPLLELDEQIKDKDEWFEFNQQQDIKLDERFGKETYGDGE